jgi:hypothetical protein
MGAWLVDVSVDRFSDHKRESKYRSYKENDGGIDEHVW